MSELYKELSDLAKQINDCPDDTVADFAGQYAAMYKQERLAIVGLIAVDSMVKDGPEQIDVFDQGF